MLEEPKALYGLYQMNKAKKALNRLSNWNPIFRSGESILNEATAKTPRGYSAQEQAAFTNNLAKLNNQRYRQSSQGNPNLAGNAINYGNLSALNDFAKNDASLKRQQIDRLSGMIRSQDNMNVSNQINQKSQMEQAYGDAYKAGLSNIVGAFDSKMNDFKTVASFIIPGAGVGGGGSAGQQSLGQMAAGSVTPSASSGGVLGNKVASSYQAPINNSWRPLDTPVTAPTMPTNPYPMSGWINNPNQYNPYQ